LLLWRIEEILKQRRVAQTAVDRPNTEALKKAREVRLKQIEMNAIIKECIIYLIFVLDFFPSTSVLPPCSFSFCLTYLIFVLVVYFISYQERDKRSFLFAQNIKNQFFGGKPSFSNVRQRCKPASFFSTYLLPFTE